MNDVLSGYERTTKGVGHHIAILIRYNKIEEMRRMEKSPYFPISNVTDFLISTGRFNIQTNLELNLYIAESRNGFMVKSYTQNCRFLPILIDASSQKNLVDRLLNSLAIFLAKIILKLFIKKSILLQKTEAKQQHKIKAFPQYCYLIFCLPSHSLITQIAQ